jgi:hypothetical protein
MNSLSEISKVIFAELSQSGKNIAVHAESNVLVIKAGSAETRILNWQTMAINSILETARSLTLQENYNGRTILHG